MIGELAVMNRVAGVTKTYVDDVFSAYTYTGNGATQTITNGIDLAGKGGMVWIKGRSGATDHQLFDTARAATYELISNSTAAQVADADTLTAFNSTGFDLGADATTNTNAATYVSWTFRKAPKFFDVVTYTGTGSPMAVNHSLGIAPGMVIIKRYDTTGSWAVWHMSGTQTNGKFGAYLNETTAYADTANNLWGSESTPPVMTSTQFNVGTAADTNSNGFSYVAYLFAHDTGADGLIQCGSFTSVGASRLDINLGFEPQFLMIKRSNSTSQWFMTDSSRGMPAVNVEASNDPTSKVLFANLSNAEGGYSVHLRQNGFSMPAGQFAGAGETYIYLAIRRPNKPPTSGTQVYNAIARTGTGAAATVTGVGFAADLHAVHSRSGTTGGRWEDRLRGATQELVAETTAAEAAVAQSVTSFGMDGSSIGTDGDWNTNTATYIDHYFKRSPGVVDIVCYTGTGANKTETHNLAKAPELWLVKGRSGATEWVWGSSLIANTEKIVMPSPNGVVTDATAWNSTYPTSTAFSLGTAAAVNTNAATYVTYLWATLAGIGKVGTYTGNGSNQTINCGFSTGARFVLIIRTTASTAQDIFIWDTVRGIVAGNDPHLSLNTTSAEVTTDDSIDPDTSGFIVNQLAATDINVTSAIYIFLAVA